MHILKIINKIDGVNLAYWKYSKQYKLMMGQDGMYSKQYKLMMGQDGMYSKQQKLKIYSKKLIFIL